MDSVTLAASLVHEGHEVKAVSFVYGSKHNQYERAAAIQSAARLGIELRQVDLASAFAGFKSNLLLTGDDIPEGHYNDASMSQTVVPGRNLIFVAFLAGLAESLGFNEVALGVHAGDHHIYPDCRPEFVQAAKVAVAMSTEYRVGIIAPFLYDNKADILRRGFAIGVDYSLTRTCYKDQALSCGKCGSCRERLKRLNKCNIRTLYSMNVTIRKLYRVEMAHQLDAAVTKACSETIHGHSYVIEVFLRGPLDATGMVRDFGDLTAVKALVMEFDHALIVPASLGVEALSMLADHNRKLVVTPYNPTAERMAIDLLSRLRLREPLVFKVRIHETETGYAEVEI
jgi:7-cyano-7-deazaguanine synthase